MTTPRPGRGADQFALRLPDGMRERIKLAADLNNRSMNAEIVATLEKEYPPLVPDPELQEFVEKHLQSIGIKDKFHPMYSNELLRASAIWFAIKNYGAGAAIVKSIETFDFSSPQRHEVNEKTPIGKDESNNP